MTKNDITRGLIDFAVSQCLKNIKEDPYRSIRRLADLGRQFAKGRFQEEQGTFSGRAFFPLPEIAAQRRRSLL